MLPGRMKRMRDNMKKVLDEMASEKEEKTEDAWTEEARKKALEARRENISRRADTDTPAERKRMDAFIAWLRKTGRLKAESESKTKDGGPGSGIKGHTTAEEEHSKSINLPDRLKAPKEDPYSKAWNNFAELAYKELGPSWEGNVNYDTLTRKLSKEAIRRYYIFYNQLK